MKKYAVKFLALTLALVLLSLAPAVYAQPRSVDFLTNMDRVYKFGKIN